MSKPRKPSLLDRAIEAVAPKWGLERAKARTAALAVRHYEAASVGRRTSGWRRSSGDANAVIRPALVRLREYSRDLHRNNGWARRGISVIVNNTVGWGIIPSVDGDEQRQLAVAVMPVWNAWADGTACDVDGRMSFYGLQHQAMQAIVQSGEVLIRRHTVPSESPGALPLQIQVLEPDYIDTLHDSVKGPTGGPIIQGIEFDSQGRRTAYYLFDQHPGALRRFGPIQGNTPGLGKRVPAEDVIHCYLVDRPGQVRGVPWLAAAVLALQDLSEYEGAALMRQKIAACFAAFVVDPEGVSAPIGEKHATDPLLETLEPGMVQYLRPGQDIRFGSPPSESGYDQFTKAQLRRLAAALGITYEDLTGDYSGSNFSSARMARLTHWSNVHAWRWHMLIPQLCDGVWRWAMDAAVASRMIRQVPRATWTPPPMPLIEPDKEGLAYKRLMRAGVMTLPEALRERGRDPKAHLAELAGSNAELDRLGIWLDSDPRKTSDAGLTQERAGGGGGGAQPVVSADAS